MLRISSIFYFLSLVSQTLSAQVLPQEGKILNYRLIGFSFPASISAVNYTVEIAAGNHNTDESFRKNVIKKIPGITNKIIAEMPSFGSQYTWRTIYASGSASVKSELHHFTTGAIAETDTGLVRLRVTKPAQKYKDAYIFLDGSKVLYDMSGKPVWYLPQVDGLTHAPRDLKITSRGTITFLANLAYEINYDGEVLWKSPKKNTVSGEKEEQYHHEFTRLSNGHYMVLGSEKVKLPAKYSGLTKGAENGKLPLDEDAKANIAKFGTIIEYDQAGNVVWSWKSSSYFMQPSVLAQIGDNINIYDVHDNSFYFDESAKVIYLSLKGINTLLKLQYPEGKVISSYGETPKPGTGQKGERLFCGQHSVSRSKQGCLFVFNNNGCGDLPKVKQLKEPLTPEDRMKILWEYQCTTDDKNKKQFLSGGSVTELPDGSMLVCMGGNYSKVFIVNKDKKILWSALPERNEGNPEADNIHQYRASIVKNRMEIERLVWGNKLKNKGASSKRVAKR